MSQKESKKRKKTSRRRPNFEMFVLSLSSSSSSLSPLLCTHQWATGARVLSSQWKRSEIDWLFERARTAKKTFKFKIKQKNVPALVQQHKFKKKKKKI
jgi:hypothetical protein